MAEWWEDPNNVVQSETATVPVAANVQGAEWWENPDNIEQSVVTEKPAVSGAIPEATSGAIPEATIFETVKDAL